MFFTRRTSLKLIELIFCTRQTSSKLIVIIFLLAEPHRISSNLKLIEPHRSKRWLKNQWGLMRFELHSSMRFCEIYAFLSLPNLNESQSYSLQNLYTYSYRNSMLSYQKSLHLLQLFCFYTIFNKVTVLRKKITNIWF